MHLGRLQPPTVLSWAVVLAVVLVLVLRARRDALGRYGSRATKERRVALGIALAPLLALVLAVVHLGVSAEVVDPSALANVDSWRKVSLALMLANAACGVVACALVVVGMLRRTSNGRILTADLATAFVGLWSLWATAQNYPAPG